MENFIPSIMDTQDTGFSEFGNLASILGDPFHDENSPSIFEPPLGNVHITSNNTGGNQVQEQDNNVEIYQQQEYQDASFYSTEEPTYGENFFHQVRELANQVELDSLERPGGRPSLGEASVALQGRPVSRPTHNQNNGRITRKRRSRILTPKKKEAEKIRSKVYRDKTKDHTKKLELENANLKKEKDNILVDKEISELIQNWQRAENENLRAEICRLQNLIWQMKYCLVCSSGLPCWQHPPHSQ